MTTTPARPVAVGGRIIDAVLAGLPVGVAAALSVEAVVAAVRGDDRTGLSSPEAVRRLAASAATRSAATRSAPVLLVWQVTQSAAGTPWLGQVYMPLPDLQKRGILRVRGCSSRSVSEAFAERARRALLTTGEATRKREIEVSPSDELTTQNGKIGLLVRDDFRSGCRARLFISLGVYSGRANCRDEGG